MGLTGGRWKSRAARRWLKITAVVGALVAATVALGLWTTPPGWLAGPQRLAAAVLRWTQTHVLTVGGIGLLVSMLAFIDQHLERRREHPSPPDDRRRARDRQIMLDRVRYRWITSVLDQSLAHETRIRLGLARRPDAILTPAMTVRTPGGNSGPLPGEVSITKVFDQLGGGLLILGAPGSGKTIALLELARELLDSAEADQSAPLPVVFNLSSWAATRLRLDEWLVKELHASYKVARGIGRQWLDDREVLPLLDGLDEVATAHRGKCVEAINAFQETCGPVRLVVCSRTGDYTDLTVRLQVEEAIELQPPTRRQVVDYLQAAGSTLADVRAALEADESLWELVRSPLVLTIAALAYHDRPADALRAAGTPHQRLTLLFEAYTERMLAHRPNRYTPVQMRRWLVWLARSMHQHSLSEFHLDRLTPDWLPTPTQQRLVTLIPGLTAVLVFVLVFGLVEGLVVGLVDERFTPNEGIRRSARHALVVGLVSGLFSGLGVGLLVGLFSGLIGGLLVGLRTGGLACLQHLVLRVLLVSNGFAPLGYVRFLDEATGRLFLRRAGSGYLFVHRLLLDYLAQLKPGLPVTADRSARAQSGRAPEVLHER
jgi:DNA polymerase III delta prime subunit